MIEPVLENLIQLQLVAGEHIISVVNVALIVLSTGVLLPSHSTLHPSQRALVKGKCCEALYVVRVVSVDRCPACPLEGLAKTTCARRRLLHHNDSIDIGEIDALGWTTEQTK